MERTIFQLIEAHLHTHCTGAWPGTLRDYLARVLTQPSLVQQAPAQLYTMLKTAGVYVDEEGKEHHTFLENDLLGIDVPLARVMEHFKAAAVGSDVGRYILLFYGPPSSGKRQPVMLLQRGRKASTPANMGAVYAVTNCPQHAEPLSLMPYALRRAFQEETGLRIGGSCAHCAPCTCVKRTRTTFVASPCSGCLSRQKNASGSELLPPRTPNPNIFPRSSGVLACPQSGIIAPSRTHAPTSLTRWSRRW
jgi:predicted Ser/Thr protein kinase